MEILDLFGSVYERNGGRSSWLRSRRLSWRFLNSLILSSTGLEVGDFLVFLISTLLVCVKIGSCVGVGVGVGVNM